MTTATYSPAETRLARSLYGLAALLALATLAALAAPLLWPDASILTAPPFFVTNSIAGLGLLALLAWCAGADVRRFRALIGILIGGFGIGAAGSLLLLAQPHSPDQTPPLVATLIICTALGLLLGAGLLAAGRTAPAWSPWLPAKPPQPLERAAQVFFGALTLATLVAALISLFLPSIDGLPVNDLTNNPLMILGSSIKLGLLGLLALPLMLDVRRHAHHSQMIVMLAVGNSISLASIIWLALAGFARFGDYTLITGGMTLTRETMMLAAGLLDVTIVTALIVLNRQLNRALLDHIEFLDPAQFRALESIVETLVAGDGDEVIPAYEVVLRTDSYLRSFRSDRLGLAKLAIVGLMLAPLGWLKPPITYLNPAARADFINRRFKEELIDQTPLYRLADGLLRAVNRLLLRLRGRSDEEIGAALSFTGLLEAMMRFNMQLTYLGYYSSEAVWQHESGIGYVPFSKRQKDFDVRPIQHHPPLDVTTPETLTRKGIDVIDDADVVIIGSGAAGAVLAEQMAAQGRRVLILEKGLYVPPEAFNEDEIDMISRLYSDGALQISQALRFTILQGSCVGGTTVVNNAVCFDTPQTVLDAWNARSSNGKVIEDAQFYESQRFMRGRMRIGPIRAGTRQPIDKVLNHGDSLITAAVHNYFAHNPGGHTYDVVEANIVDCLGCGYCNMGCKYGRKLSMLDLVLPDAQHRHGADNFQIISEAQAERLVTSGDRVTEIQVRVAGKRRLHIRNPRTVIVSGGTIHSSWLLMQSGIGAGKLPVGRGLSFNMGSPLHARFDQVVNAYDGLQIAHYLKLDDHPGFVYESWYNPPVAQALAMPGWLDTHFRNMQNYNRMIGVGVLIGTESNAHIERALLTRGPDVVFQPRPGDMKKLVDALVILGEILFAGGAQEIYASTRRYQPYRDSTAIIRAQTEIDRLRDLVKEDADILLGTGHPQGGNAIGTSPHNSVIGPDFRVFGYRNLYVCDASIFPTATTVNPQLTVMTMAHYAAQHIE